MLERILDTPLTPALSMGTLSITINGSFDALSEEPPRIRMVAAPPGVPSLVVTFTPATLPEIISCGFTTRPLFLLSGFKADTEPVRSDFFAIP